MIGVILAACSSVLWGSSDFAAGVASRRVGAMRTSFWAFVGGTALLALSLLFWPWEWSTPALLGGLAAGVGSAIGLVAFFASLSLAPMGVASAIVATSEIAVPVLVGVVWKGDELGPIAWIGLVTASVGAVIVGGAEGSWGGAGLKAVLLAVASGVGFGLALVALDVAPETSGYFAPTVEMFTGTVLVALMLAGIRLFPTLRSAANSVGLIGVRLGSGRDVLLGLVAGALLGIASIALMLALWIGPLAVVGPITCLYPVTAAILARVILKERLRRLHVVGIAIALIGCMLIGVS